ncbi:MAG: hypothetical protein MO846_04455 [Candidatus Devosia symbiotica]|nr:hypothetical protein [Candidatus Devosia symbiotica]
MSASYWPPRQSAFQRLRRRGSAQGVIGAYASGAKIAVKRMPVGYRQSVVA